MKTGISTAVSAYGSFTAWIQSFANLAAFPITGRTGVIYIDLSADKCYIWDYVSSSYVEVSSITPVIDNLTSTSTTSALSANQGKVLKGLIDGIVYEVPLTFTLPILRSVNTISLKGLTGFGTAGQVIKTNATADGLEWGTGGGLSNVVEDTTPQLGGDIDTNSNDIKFLDNDKAIFGTGLDGEIYSDGDNLIIRGLTSNKKIKFFGNFGGVDTEVMTIDLLTKNIGFGASDPTARATFVSGGAGSVPFRISDGGTGLPLVDMAQGGSGNANLVFNAITGKTGVLLGGTLQAQLNNGVSVGWRFREGSTSAKTASVVGTGLENITPSTYGAECLTNGALTSGTSWTASGDATLTADTAVFAYSAGTTTYISQAAASLATAMKTDTWYAFTFTVTGATANQAGYPALTITCNTGVLATFTGYNGTLTIYFKTNATAVSYFRIGAALSSGQACTLDTLSLKEITSGGLYTGGGANGLNILQNGDGVMQGDFTSNKFKLAALNTAPANAADTGTLGEIRWANGYVYFCVATNTWQRAALATW